jgi:hypothetical protein
LERSDNPGKGTGMRFSTLKEFANLPTLSALIPNNAVVPGLSLRSNPDGLKLANAFGVDEKLLKKTRTRELATQRTLRLNREEAFYLQSPRIMNADQ